ncbi:DUF2313 domain-containing protein [Lichenicola cladoniae]|uniref:DUF2313 domain-containing protein n=1 Tax=Lichenicola cladoniae TaxID=1484109 RepID=A0A6M8HN14_9PROT|nr:putative phage tail protein [Lichenicola cladoniae]NPD67311.1 DUF2313 domain-containing protein [Acetobacteraceae bacterium]QKE89813.1 DUF2313 domain-containing protein [Lichenicola cladoniae]
MAYTSADFLSLLQGLLPTGPVWPRDPAAIQTQVLAALVPTYANLAERDENLLFDAFPATADELLPEWEYSLGLPDPCAGNAATLELRRAQVVARFTALGGQSIDYLVAFAAALGYAISISEYAPRRFGAGFGQPMNGEAWAFAWQVSTTQFSIIQRKFGDVLGEPFATWGSTVLLCELQRLSPAHTTIIFNFAGVTWDTFDPDVDVLPA